MHACVRACACACVCACVCVCVCVCVCARARARATNTLRTHSNVVARRGAVQKTPRRRFHSLHGSNSIVRETLVSVGIYRHTHEILRIRIDLANCKCLILRTYINGRGKINGVLNMKPKALDTKLAQFFYLRRNANNFSIGYFNRHFWTGDCTPISA